jgi:hypothetical protein
LRRYKILVTEEERESGGVSETQTRTFEGNLDNASSEVRDAVLVADNVDGLELPPPQESEEEKQQRLLEEQQKKENLQKKREDPANVVKTWLTHLPKDIDSAKTTMVKISGLQKVPNEVRDAYTSQFAQAIQCLTELRSTMEDASAQKQYDLDLQKAQASVLKLKSLIKEWNGVLEIYDPAAVEKPPAPRTVKKGVPAPQ